MFDHTTIGLGALLIVAGLAIAPGASAATGDEIIAGDDGWIRVTDGQQDDGTDEQAMCGGMAPLETECTTGTWRIWGSYGIGIYPSQRLPTYTLESRMVHDTGEDKFLRCSFVAGQVQGCEVGGDWPTLGATFEHVCTVTWPSPLPISDQQGGLDEWACDVVADPVS